MATPEYKLAKVYGKNPTEAITEMSKIATVDEITDILTSMPEISYKSLRTDIAATDLEHTVNLESLTQFFASSGDTISLAEHHLYGSSRLGVQRYDSTTVANILNLPEADAAHLRSTLRNRQPWYSYPFADLIDSTKRDPYAPGLTGNAYLGKWTTSRTLGRKYYEMTDHLGNVLATVLDRKTGNGTLSGSSGTLYDHWSADLASTADYYPGGMMMPNRNTEYSWSRMGYNGQSKDDEVYGKGNLNSTFFRQYDTRLLRWHSIDPMMQKYPGWSPYVFAFDNPICYNDPNGDEPPTIRQIIIQGQKTSTVFAKLLTKNSINANNYNSSISWGVRTETDLTTSRITLTKSEDIKFQIIKLTHELTNREGINNGKKLVSQVERGIITPKQYAQKLAQDEVRGEINQIKVAVEIGYRYEGEGTEKLNKFLDTYSKDKSIDLNKVVIPRKEHLKTYEAQGQAARNAYLQDHPEEAQPKNKK